MKKKILLIAFACKPNEGSESGVGWNFIKLIQKIENLDVHVLTWAGENQVKLLSSNKDVDVKYIFYDLPFLSKLQKKQTHNGQKFMELYYMLWQLGALIHVIKKYGRNYFDIVHHITFVSATLPSLFVFMKAKFIWGPLSSNDIMPKVLSKNKKKSKKLVLKEVIKLLVRKFSVIYKINKIKAEKIIVNTIDIIELVNINDKSKVEVISSVGVEKDIKLSNIDKKVENIKEEVKIFSIGKFLDIKNFDLTIEAFNQLSKRRDNVKLYIIGDGPNREKLEKLIVELNLKEKVELKGWVDRKEVIDYLANESHILLYPTAEKAGMTILEALALGNPVVAMNYGGPKEFVNQESGVLVEVTERKIIIEELAKALEKVIDNYKIYCEGATKGIDKFKWDEKLYHLQKVYDSIEI